MPPPKWSKNSDHAGMLKGPPRRRRLKPGNNVFLREADTLAQEEGERISFRFLLGPKKEASSKSRVKDTHELLLR